MVDSFENFLITAKISHITPYTIIFCFIQDDFQAEFPTFEFIKEELKKKVDSALIKINCEERESIIYKSFYNLYHGYEGVKSLNEIGAFCYNESSLNENDPSIIPRNINELRDKLTAPVSDEDTELCDAVLGELSNINIDHLSWKDPLASQVLEENSWLINSLDDESRKQFMEPKKLYMPKIGDEINIKCIRYSNEYFQNRKFSSNPVKVLHDSTWKESLSRQKEVVDDILRVLKEIWNNPIYSMDEEFLKKLNEGTYFVDVINPILRAAINGIDCDNTYLTVAEMQSIASQIRKNNFSNYSQIGNKPDAIYALYYQNKYELLYVESSRISCTTQKMNDDYVKLWRLCNDGISWIFNSCSPPKNQFCLLGIQIHGTVISLNALMKDSNDINRYFNLCRCEIPLVPCESNVIVKLVTLLLTLRNILIVNISLLKNELIKINRRIKNQNSPTVSTPKKKKRRKSKLIKVK